MTERIEIRGPSLELRLGAATEPAFEAAARRASDERWIERLFDRDASLWSADPRVQASISERLGWLDAPLHFTEQIPALEAFGDAIRDAGFGAAIVAGMGGSSLAPDVIHRTFGTAHDWLQLRVLDSTDPEAVAATVDDLQPLATLFIVATKSGTTTEPLAFQADAWARIKRALKAADAGGSPGQFMVAITDPGKSVSSIPHHDELRELFLNPADIGGRYSALSYVGLVAGSLIGLDLDPFLASATSMLAHSSAEDHLENPALALGLAIGTLAVAGRDKLTFVPDPEVASFGMWAEQLLAESTGKQGVGIVPVDQEPLGSVAAYGRDRAFVRIRVEGSAGPMTADGRPADTLLDELAAAGHPVIRVDLPDPIDLAGEFVRWEVATAIAGIILGIDPFDQPNVEEAKENTRRLLARRGGPTEAARSAGDARAESGSEEPGEPIAAQGALTLFADTALRLSSGDGTAPGELRRQLARLKPAGYIALHAYLAPTAARDLALARIRTVLRDATLHATTSGYGPRFLHSTGQLHKGGPPIGWFVQLTADHPHDRPIPGWPYTFGQLIDAQAQGDFETLESHDLPVLRIHLGTDPDAGLAELEQLLVETFKEA